MKGMIIMKRNAGKVFAKLFFKSFFVVIFLLLTGVLSYKAAMLYWQPKSEDTKTAFQENTSPDGIVKVDNQGVSKNLICCYAEDTGDITKLILEIFDSEEHKLTYLTIPVKTQLTISNTLYQRLILDDPEIPQVLKLSTITKYLDTDEAYNDEVMIVEELLGTDINYYTAIPKETFDTMFKDKAVTQSDQYDAISMEVFSGDYKKLLNSLDSRDKIEAYIKELYPKLQSNLTLENKLDFMDAYEKTSQKDISFKLIPGDNMNSEYVINKDQTAQLMKELSGID